MAMWMCSITLSDGSAVSRISNEPVREKLGIESVHQVVLNEMAWTVERMNGEWLGVCMNIVGRVSRGRPRLTWYTVLHNACWVKGLRRNAPLDHSAWRDARMDGCCILAHFEEITMVERSIILVRIERLYCS